MDVLGMVGVAPGIAWTGGGVSTAGQSIGLRPEIATDSLVSTQVSGEVVGVVSSL